MKPANIPLTIYQGSTFRKVFTWNTGTPDNLVPVDITGCILHSQARPSVLSDTILFDITNDFGINILDAVAGKFEIVLSAEETAAFSFKKAVYDIEIVFPLSEGSPVYRLIEGTITLNPEVTKVIPPIVGGV